MQDYKNNKILELIKEMVKVPNQTDYEINGVDTSRALFFYRKEREKFKIIPRGSYTIVDEASNKYLRITDSSLLGEAIEFQICYLFVKTSSSYVDEFPEITLLQEHYNQLYDDFNNLLNQLKSNNILGDTLKMSYVLPQLNEGQVWVLRQGEMKAENIFDLDERLKEALEQFKILFSKWVDETEKPRFESFVDEKILSASDELDGKTELEKIELEDYTEQKKNDLDIYLTGRKPIQYATIAELKASTNLKIGDYVEVTGYYAVGDGANHKRIIADSDDGSGVQMDNGLWANIVHNGEVNVSWFGAKGDGVTDDTEGLLYDCKNYKIDRKIIANNPVKIKKHSSVMGVVSDFEETGGNVYSDFYIQKNFTSTINIKSEDPTYPDSGQVSTLLYFDNEWSKNNCYPQDYYLKNLTLKGNGVGYGIYAIYGGQCVIDRVNTFENEYGLYFRNFWKYKITNSRFSDKIYLGGGTSAVIENCSVESLEMFSTDYSSVSNCSSDHSKEIPYNITGVRGIFDNLGCESIGNFNNKSTAFIFGECNIELRNPIIFRTSNPNATGGVFKFIGGNTITIKKGSYGIGGLDKIDVECIGDDNAITFVDFNFLKGIPTITINGKNNIVTIKNTVAKLYYVIESDNNGVVRKKTCIQTPKTKPIIEPVTLKNFVPKNSELTYYVNNDSIYSSFFIDFGSTEGNNHNVEIELKYAPLTRIAGVLKEYTYIVEPNSKTCKFFNGAETLKYSEITSEFIFCLYYIIGLDEATFIDLNTPYHVEKMKQEGIYTDFISYMDEKTAYDNKKREDEKNLQEAYKVWLESNPDGTYEEFVNLIPNYNNLMLLPEGMENTNEEPQPSEALLKFKEKYLG